MKLYYKSFIHIHVHVHVHVNAQDIVGSLEWSVVHIHWVMPGTIMMTHTCNGHVLGLYTEQTPKAYTHAGHLKYYIPMVQICTLI